MTGAPSRWAPPVPPGSGALRELCHVVTRALTIPDVSYQRALGHAVAGHADDIAALRLYRERTGMVLEAMRRLLADREADDADVMMFVVSLREQIAMSDDRPMVRPTVRYERSDREPAKG